MTHTILIALYIVLMIVVVISVDLLFLRELFWARMIGNIGIVTAFGVFYLRFLHGP